MVTREPSRHRMARHGWSVILVWSRDGPANKKLTSATSTTTSDSASLLNPDLKDLHIALGTNRDMITPSCMNSVGSLAFLIKSSAVCSRLVPSRPVKMVEASKDGGIGPRMFKEAVALELRR